MVRLKNIRKSNTTIFAEYDPEDSGMIGKIKIDAVTGEVLERTLSEYDRDFPWHYSHAVSALQEMKDLDEIPSERLVMWY